MGYLLSKVSKHNPCWHEILLKLPDLTMFKTLVQVYWLKLIIIALYPFQFKSIRKSFVLIRFADKNLFWHGITLFYYLTSCGQKQPFRGVLIFLPPHPPPPPFLKPLKIRKEFLVFKIWTKRGVMKKLLRNRRSAERRELSLKDGFPYCFISFSSEKHVFITIGILFFSFLSGKNPCFLFMLPVINRSILSCGLLSTRKWYITKFTFLLLLFLNKTLWKFYY